MADMGELGFWLAAGAVVVALIIRGWLRERDKRDMIHDLLKTEADGKITEVLAYLREKEAEERKLTRQMWGLGGGSSEDSGPRAAIFVACPPQK